MRVVWGRKQSEMKELERDRTEEMRKELARKIKTSNADQFCHRIFSLSGVGFLIASICWKPGGYDFNVSFSKGMEGFGR